VEEVVVVSIVDVDKIKRVYKIISVSCGYKWLS